MSVIEQKGASKLLRQLADDIDEGKFAVKNILILADLQVWSFEKLLRTKPFVQDGKLKGEVLIDDPGPLPSAEEFDKRNRLAGMLNSMEPPTLPEGNPLDD